MRICFVSGSLECCTGCLHAEEHDIKFVTVQDPQTKKKVVKNACDLGCGKDAKQKCVTVS